MLPLSVTEMRSFISRTKVFSRMLSPGAIAAMNLSGLNCACAENLTAPAALLEKRAQALNAPVNGNMERQIHESASCRAAYRFEKNGQALLDFQTDRASFEFEY